MTFEQSIAILFGLAEAAELGEIHWRTLAVLAFVPIDLIIWSFVR